jgi:hypothetical protein
MSLVFATILGFMFSPQPNALCAEVLHQLRHGTPHGSDVSPDRGRYVSVSLGG